MAQDIHAPDCPQCGAQMTYVVHLDIISNKLKKQYRCFKDDAVVPYVRPSQRPGWVAQNNNKVTAKRKSTQAGNLGIGGLMASRSAKKSKAGPKKAGGKRDRR